jgi:hypothetical protein
VLQAAEQAGFTQGEAAGRRTQMQADQGQNSHRARLLSAGEDCRKIYNDFNAFQLLLSWHLARHIN